MHVSLKDYEAYRAYKKRNPMAKHNCIPPSHEWREGRVSVGVFYRDRAGRVLEASASNANITEEKAAIALIEAISKGKTTSNHTTFKTRLGNAIEGWTVGEPTDGGAWRMVAQGLNKVEADAIARVLNELEGA